MKELDDGEYLEEKDAEYDNEAYKNDSTETGIIGNDEVNPNDTAT